MYKVIIDLNQLQQGIQRMERNFPTAINEGLEEIAQKAQTGAQADAAVDTGNMRDKIQITDKGQNYIVVEATAEYSGFVEFGTSRGPAQPFMGPQADRMETEAPRIMLNKLKQRLSL